jgi:hypothetical protein
MKKLLSIFIVFFFLINGIGAAAYYGNQSTSNNLEIQTLHENIIAYNLVIQQSEFKDYLSITMEGTSSYVSYAGQPRLPKIVKIIELPFGVNNVNVDVKVDNFETLEINSQVKPASVMLPLSDDYSSNIKTPYKDESIYESTSFYPETWFNYKVGVGLNDDNEHVTFVVIDYYPVRYSPASNILYTTKNADVTLTYTASENNPFPTVASADLVIIAPSAFEQDLQRLIDHKNNLNINTILKTTEDIYNEYQGADQPEQIKYYIKDAVESLGVTYVLLVGGLKNVIFAKPKDDTNQGSRDWYIPVRYTNLWDNPKFPLSAESSIHDPGQISDLYYADIYKNGGEFESWDTNGDGIFLAWGLPGVDNDTDLDLFPDVVLSRLACRNTGEVQTVVDKIITYESSACDPSWFRKMIVVSGDGFLDQEDLNILWDTNQVADGDYVINAQSHNPENEFGPILSFNVVKDHSQESVITYSHDDHLNPAIQDAFENGFPTVPIAEIVSISEGDILGNTDIAFEPTSGAYCNEFFFWANVSYIDGILTIRGKSYDPKPYGNVSSFHIWIENDQGEIVFEDWRNDTEMYFEGEWTTGEKALLGRGGALYYMPEDFEKELLWTSNGNLRGMDDVLSSVSEGAGFLFFSGHGSPNVWADQYPGIPGDRGPAGVTGLQVTTFRPWPPFFGDPAFPIDSLSNAEKLPIAVVGGCHNSQFNVSMVYGLLDIMNYYFPAFPKLQMWLHGSPVPETFSWRLIRSPNGGSIASIGNTGLGYGMPGKDLTTGGGDSWITIEFFRQYGEEGQEILGEAYTQTLNDYLNTFDMLDLEAGHPKTITQWALLGDPTLKIGGYE